MNIYSKNSYRKIYESFYGPIPKDSNGRSYEIHHIDGDHSNNNINNLKAVTIEEHYDIHYSQGDWAACLIMSERMKISPKEKSELARKVQLAKIEKGIHHFQNTDQSPSLARIMVERGDHPFLGSEKAIAKNKKRVDAGTHNFLGKNNPTHKKIEEGTHHFQTRNPSKINIINGTHHFLNNHPNKIQVTCPHCNRTGGKTNMNRYHFDNCKRYKK